LPKIQKMIRYAEHYSLKPYNTFGVGASARYFFEFTEVSDLQDLTGRGTLRGEQRLILGGGSNLLLVGDFPGWVIFPNLPGITIEKETRSQIWVRAGAGVIWDDLVEYVVREGWGGVENLSLIPGRTGAAPVQNIGAYGQELSETVVSVSGVDILTGEHEELSAPDCRFGYRQSIFKQTLKEQFVITSVLFCLEKFPEPVLSYQGVAEALGDIPEPGIADVREAIIRIRQSKLPDHRIFGNAGSFFKNPVVSAEIAMQLKEQHPGIPVYDTSGPDMRKLSAGWLIDHCGWKGFRRGDAGVHEKHALVLVNFGNATGNEIFSLSEDIIQDVHARTGVVLEREVNIAGQLP
jgi:UDP-N-acetylmuramate dehydrogenase